jgi:hypothetical protein
MGTKSRETIYGSSIRASAERAVEARKEADRLACVCATEMEDSFALHIRRHRDSVCRDNSPPCKRSERWQVRLN